MSERVLLEQQFHVAPDALEAIAGDRSLALDEVAAGESVVVAPDQLQTLGEAVDFMGHNPSQELKGVMTGMSRNVHFLSFRTMLTVTRT